MEKAKVKEVRVEGLPVSKNVTPSTVSCSTMLDVPYFLDIGMWPSCEGIFRLGSSRGEGKSGLRQEVAHPSRAGPLAAWQL